MNEKSQRFLRVPLLFGLVVVLTLLVVPRPLWRRHLSSINPPPWNQIVFITIDTLRADHLGSYGYPRPASPFLDKQARQGVVFEHAYTASSHTAPSHATMFTALYPFEHRLLTNGPRLGAQVRTLHGLMTGAGYQSAGFPAVLFLNGALGFPKAKWTAPLKQNGKQFLYRDAVAIVDDALSFLRKHKSSERLFLWLHFYDVHEWRRKNLIPPDALQKIKAMNSSFSEEHTFARRPQDGYDAQLLYVDGQIERLYREMDAQGFGESALWIVTSDHGEGLGNHRYTGHGKFIYQEQLKVPLILWAADLPVGKRISDMARTVDYLPTIAEAAGISASMLPKTQGRSLFDLLRGGNAEKKYAYAQRRPKDEAAVRRNWDDGEMYSIHDFSHKYIFRSGHPSELYDLRNDPLELQNIIEASPEGAAELEAKLFSIRPRDADQEPSDQEPVDPKVLEELKTLGYL